MIKVFNDGPSFYNETKDFLLTNKYTEAFFRLDSPMLLEVNKEEYAIKVYDESSTLVILSKKPYNLLLYGDLSLCSELIDYLIDNNYEIRDFLCPMDLGDELLSCFKSKGYDYDLSIGMDFMEAKDKVELPSVNVEHASIDDLDEIYELVCHFVKDCGLKDSVDKEWLKAKIDMFRVLRKDNKIISMAKLGPWTEHEMKIAYVYTRDEYRGKGYARVVVGSTLNEIIDMGYIATLNVDKKNPISNHIYTSLGFKRVFSQGVYVLKQE